MVFTRRFEISHLHVMVINPNLISHTVNVVIGENLYELKFRVENGADGSNPQLMDMDSDHGADEGENQKENNSGGGSGKLNHILATKTGGAGASSKATLTVVGRQTP
jgi:hypothetical protein